MLIKRIYQADPPRCPKCGITHEVDPDFPKHARRKACEQLELPWEAWTRRWIVGSRP
ncbi:MAG TPA: hypothetical protein VNA25_27720 [Phycisphaerae bacterium]|nr:hypothetical protein [Phycisphaerae bacterium]